MSKSSIFNGILWNTVDKFLLQIIKFTVNIFLARLLLPSDFGLIAIVVVFTSMIDTIVQGGIRQAIIMRTELEDIDYSTAFVYNISVAVFLYIAMFFFAPFIASFYDNEKLVVILRVISLSSIIHAGYFVQDAMFQKKMRFKSLAKRNILASLIAGLTGIVLAYFGFGVWSLILMNLCRGVVVNVYLWLNSIWKISIKFSLESFKKVFSFSLPLLLTHITGAISINLNNLLIGKFYTQTDLGYYYQANKLKTIPVLSVTQILTKTSTPQFSNNQNNLIKLNVIYSKIIKMTLLIMLPTVSILFVMGGDIILLLLTDKWIESVPFFKILIISGFFAPFIAINGLSSAIMGNSKFFFKVDLLYKIIFLTTSIISIRFGIFVLIISQLIYHFVQMIANFFIAAKFYCLNLKYQIIIILKYLLFAVGASILAYIIGSMFYEVSVIKLVAQVFSYIVSFSITVYIFDQQYFNEICRKLLSMKFLNRKR